MDYFFVDWCPSSDPSNAFRRAAIGEQVTARQLNLLIQQIGSQYEVTLHDLNISMRMDGIFLFSMSVDEHQNITKSKIYDSARDISLWLKSEIFRHIHVHHGEGNISGGASHYPVSFVPPSLGEAENDYSTTYNILTSEEKQEYICKLSRSSIILSKLMATDKNGRKTETEALILLVSFIGRQHDQCMRFLKIFDKSWETKKFELTLGGVFMAIFGGALIFFLMKFGLKLFGDYPISEDKTNVVVIFTAAFFGVSAGCYRWLSDFQREKLNPKKQTVMSSLGYLARGNALAIVADSIFTQRFSERTSTDQSEKPQPTLFYAGIVDSLECIRQHIDFELESARFGAAMFMALVGIYFAGVAVVIAI